MKHLLYGQILVESVENWNDCKSGDIGSKLSQTLIVDVAKAFKYDYFVFYFVLFFVLSIVFFVFLLLSIISRQWNNKASKLLNRIKVLDF